MVSNKYLIGAVGLGVVLASYFTPAPATKTPEQTFSTNQPPITRTTTRPTNQSIDSLVGTAWGEEAKKIAVEQIDSLMQRETVDSVLDEEYSSGLIQRATYNSRRTNFDELVYQNQLNPSEKKPVIVLFYDGQKDVGSIDGRNAEKRDAIVFKYLSKEYQGKINFVAFKLTNQPDYHWSVFIGSEASSERIKVPPSIALYSLFDVVVGETPNKNNGIIKQVDVMRGGPTNNTDLNIVFSNFLSYSIPPNLLFRDNAERDGGVYRLNNTYNQWIVVGNIR